MTLGKWTVYFLVLSSIAFCANPVSAYVGADPLADLAGGELKASLFVARSETDYIWDISGSGETDVEIERTIIGVNLSRGINEKWDIYGTLGYLFDGKTTIINENIDLDKGYYLSAGLKCKAFQSGKLSTYIYGQFDYVIDETYADTDSDGLNWDIAIDGFEITLGGVMEYQMDRNLSLYGGLALVPFTDQSFDVEILGGKDDGDLERDDQFGLKIGGKYNLDEKWVISGEADLVYEQTFILSVGAKF